MKGSKFALLITEERRRRKISQDTACELIGVADPSTISKWENGNVIPSDEMVIKIMNAYEEPMIGYAYLQSCTKIGKMVLPEVLLSDLDNLAINFQYELEDIKILRHDLLEIARDGAVVERQRVRWSQIQNKSSGLCRILFPLMLRNFGENKGPLQGGNLVRA